ncbi:glycosyl transferase family 2 [Desulfurella acetivorans A63]|nr:glycosyl transferase family 2 [Desulfurella acetivorans A63]
MQESNTQDLIFSFKPLISIVVPTWNTPEQFLIEMIESVLNQSYTNFELCIADASDQSHVKKILDNYADKDNRIKIKYLKKNKGIAQNTNEAIFISKGDYIAFLDHDDILAKNALFEVVKTINENQGVDFIYSDDDRVTEDGKKFFDPKFKPDLAPDFLRSCNYVCHLSVIKKKLLDKIGYLKEDFEGCQDYELILRVTEKAKKIIHIPKILYHWRVSQNSVSRNPQSKIYAYDSAKKVIKEHLNRLNLDGDVLDGKVLGLYKINYKITDSPKISIIIPNKDHKDDLEKCIKSIIQKSTYKNYEIIIVENNSIEQSIFDYYRFLEKTYSFIKVIVWDKPFNYSSINNYAVRFAQGEVLLFLNNDTEVITPNWIEEMLMFAQRDDVGAVGAKLLYPNNTIQHAGVIIGINGIAEHCFKYSNSDYTGYFARLATVQNLSAVTGACLMMRKKVFNEIKGFDEGYPEALNDIDLCLSLRKKGYLVVWTPHAVLYHYESKSRGFDTEEESIKRYNKELSLLYMDAQYNLKQKNKNSYDFKITRKLII